MFRIQANDEFELFRLIVTHGDCMTISDWAKYDTYAQVLADSSVINSEGYNERQEFLAWYCPETPLVYQCLDDVPKLEQIEVMIGEQKEKEKSRTAFELMDLKTKDPHKDVTMPDFQDSSG